MAKRKSMVRIVIGVILDVISLLLALFATVMDLFSYPIWVGILGIIGLILIILGLYTESDELPEFAKKIYRFMTGVCCVSCIGFLIGLAFVPVREFFSVRYKDLHIFLFFLSIITYVYLIHRIYIHSEPKRQERIAQKKKAESPYKYR